MHHRSLPSFFSTDVRLSCSACVTEKGAPREILRSLLCSVNDEGVQGRQPRSSQHNFGREGMTLIEIMVVIVLITLVMGGVSLGVGALDRTHMKQSTVKIAAACKFAYQRAINESSTVRLYFNLDAGTFSIEEAHGRVTLMKGASGAKETIEEGTAGSVDPWAAAQKRLEKTFTPSLGASPFTAISSRHANIALGRGIRIKKVIVPHEPEPIESKDAAIYFFPQGTAEHALVVLQDSRGVFSIEVDPTSGRATVNDREVEIHTLDADEVRP